MIEYIDGSPNVPEIGSSVLQRRVELIKPVVRDNKGKLRRIKTVHPSEVAFTWDPKLLDEWKGLKEIERIQTDHYCGHPMLVKPSIEEVLAQIPVELLDRVVAFETMTDTAKVYKSGEGHQITTVLYEEA
jgi:hypothetical protein